MEGGRHQSGDLFLQRSIGWDLGSACIHVVDIESRVGADEGGTCRVASELMHVFDGHHGEASRAEDRGLAWVLYFYFGRSRHNHDLFRSGCASAMESGSPPCP